MAVASTSSFYGLGFLASSAFLRAQGRTAGSVAGSVFSGQLDASRSLAAGGNIQSLFEGLGSRPLLNRRRDAIGLIQSNLTDLRETLQFVRNQGRSGLGLSGLIDRDVAQGIAKISYTGSGGFESRPVYESHPMYETRDVYETHNIYATRDVYGTRDVYETRQVTEQREIRATTVTGTRDLSSYNSIVTAGIVNGQSFGVQVGNGLLATVKFRDSTRIELTINGYTETITFNGTNGEWRSGLISALNKIDNLDASFTADGKLQLTTAHAESLTLTGGALGVPLPSLGLADGTTASAVVGYEEVPVTYRATQVSGTRDLSPYAKSTDAGVSNGSNFWVQVGDGSVTTIKFKDTKHIEVTTNGVTQSIAFDDANGEWRTGLLNALNSVANLSAEFGADGKLSLQTANAEWLTISGPSDPSKNPLASLGLSAGTTESTVTGYATEEVVVGQEQYVVGQEEYVAGQEQVLVGQEEFFAGFQEVLVGFEKVEVEGQVAADSSVAGLPGVVVDLKPLVAAVSDLLSTYAGSHSGADSARALAADLAVLFRSADFKSLEQRADSVALDRVLSQIDTALSGANALDAQVVAGIDLLTSANPINLSAALLDSGFRIDVGDPIGLARRTADELRGSPFGITTRYQLSAWA